MQQITGAAAVDIGGLVASGELIPRGQRWYGLRERAVLDKVHWIVSELEIIEWDNHKPPDLAVRLAL